MALAAGLAVPPPASAERCSTARLRAIQDAAARHLGVDEKPRWRGRSRWSAALPAVSVRAARRLGWEEVDTPRTAPIPVDHDVGVEVRLSWRLERLVHDPDAPRLLEAERAARRARVALDQEVTQLYFRWRRAARAAAAAEAGEDAALDEAENFAQLDALTGGWLAAERCP